MTKRGPIIQVGRGDVAALSRKARKKLGEHRKETQQRELSGGDKVSVSAPDVAWCLLFPTAWNMLGQPVRWEQETISDIPLCGKKLRGVGSTPRMAMKQLAWNYASELMRARILGEREAKRRAIRAQWPIAAELPRRPSSDDAGHYAAVSGKREAG